MIFHSDRGCQYTSAQFDCAATELGGRLFPGRKGQCWDNAVGESFFATIKTELLDDGVWPTRRSAETAIFEYIESDYNLHRRHSTLGYLSPAAYEATATAVELVPSTGRGLGRHPRRLEWRPRATS